MAELATIARPYANAVFGLAKRDSQLAPWSRMLGTLASASRHPNVRMLLDSPDLPANAKAFRLADICGDEIDDRGRKFLLALADNDRLDVLSEVYQQFEALRAEEEKSLDVEVISAYPLSAEQEARIASALRAKFNKDIAISATVDSTLIGGALIRAGDVVIDGTVRGKLAKLTENLSGL